MNLQNDTNSWQGYKNYDHFYEISRLGDIDKFFNEISSVDISLVIDGKVEYINIPCTIDIETSSMYIKDEKFATMYLWGFGFNGSSIIGRTWDELFSLLSRLSSELELSSKRILTIYIQNLGYEFQWFRKRISWQKDKEGNAKVFAMKERRPIYAVANGGIEYKCSYFLSNYSLAYIGAELLKRYPVQKAVGDLDYSLIRHSDTPLSEKEKWYQVQDLQVVMSYIQEKIESDGDITKIPLTNTGYVRNYCRNWCFTDDETNPAVIKKIRARYHKQMKSLSIHSEREYDDLKSAFGGGYTHAAAKYSGVLVDYVKSKDEASAYPGAMVSSYFPMSSGTFIGDVTLKELQFYLKHYCCLFTVTLYDVSPSFIYENYISLSHCTEIDEYVTNNGRVASAEKLTMTVTELDWDIITRTYDSDWDLCEIHGLRIYQKDYLPRPFILSILHLYQNKTSLKGVEGRETEYMVSKNMINASYGMAVTAIVRPEITYDYFWDHDPADKVSQLVDYNKNYNRFLFYPWGVWVTAHARHNLWEAILELGSDYVYSDTDSVKYINADAHEEFFKKYNLEMKAKLLKMCLHYKIPFEMCEPMTKKGVKKLIGVWEDDGVYKKFKTIGAKRYIYEYESGELLFTISGVNKFYGVPYLLHHFTELTSDEYYDLFKLAYTTDSRLYDEAKEAMEKVCELHNSGKMSYDKIFDNFNEGLYFPAEATGKQTITYIDKPTIATVTDYLGNEKICMEFSSVHMEPQDYSLSRTQEYLDFLYNFYDATI